MFDFIYHSKFNVIMKRAHQISANNRIGLSATYENVSTVYELKLKKKKIVKALYIQL